MKYPLHSLLDLQQEFENSQWRMLVLNKKLSHAPTIKRPKTIYSYLNIHTSKHINQNRNFSTSYRRYKKSLSLVDINFLRKEKIYTKLKYSRCPQYDIISGGFAAIFAGFIGFLISEKFGIELVDSGDFYIALMYSIFGVLALRPLLRIYSITNTPYTPYSFKYTILFWLDLLSLSQKFLKSFFKNLFLS